jgi:DNA-directed RNA polymerase I subunit RPA1
MCNLLLSALGRLFTSFLQLHSFTLGVEDILVTPQADNERTRIINHSRGIGNEAAAEAFAVKDPNNYGKGRATLTLTYNISYNTNGIMVIYMCNSICLHSTTNTS